MEEALRAPSWDNTQPWEIYLAGGEVLNRLREAYIANLTNCVARKPDLAAPKQWPPLLQNGWRPCDPNACRLLKRVCLDKSGLKDLAYMNYHFFHAPVVAYICMERTLTPWLILDLGLFSQSLMLAARNFGIDSAPAVTLVAHPDLIRKELKIPDVFLITIGIALGYADAIHPQNKYRTHRRSVLEAITFKGI
jgi:nitroreductase